MEEKRIRRKKHCFFLSERVCFKNLRKDYVESKQRVLEDVVMEPRQKEPESMLEESCVESLAKDDHVEVRDRRVDVDENDPVPRREWRG